eukprot:1050465-Pleurochrysis_carterae.AAC.2
MQWTAKPVGAIIRGELPYAALRLLQGTWTIFRRLRTPLRDRMQQGWRFAHKLNTKTGFSTSGARAGLLEPHRTSSGYSHAAKAGLQLRKLQDFHAPLMYPSMYDGLQMFTKLKPRACKAARRGADKQEREIERMRDALLSYNCCTGQDFAEKVSTLIRDHNLYVKQPYMGKSLGRLVIKFLPTAPAGERRALLRELTRVN